ncbi:MAG: hypothetical protein KBA31_09025 [Alphaproteobacteria bacterium]|nr:hypothetical protein [Alphaproteobacteria bacterium]
MKAMVLAVLGAGLALGGCDQVCSTVGQRPLAPPGGQACAKTVERVVAFTGAQAKDKLIVEALGPDCSNPAMFARLYDGNGRLVYADMTSGKWLMSAELFPPAGGTPQGVAETLYDIGEAGGANLPGWAAGAPAPATGSYGAFEALVPQPAYERLRALKAPAMIKRGGAESGTFYIYDPEAGVAVAVARFAV